MSFLQPWMLFALPLAALPVIIHLINQRRYQTTQWAAMMFLLAANRMNRGYARIRQWTILALRTMVIAALIFAVGRPLSSGLIGGAIGGNGSANTIVLLDRSPSMQQRDASGELTKLQSGVAKVTQTLTTLDAQRIVLIESNRSEPKELSKASELLDVPESGPSDASADMPAMMLAALDHIRDGELGQTDVWIVSDLRESDWSAKDGRWASLRDAFAEFGRRVRFRLLAFPESESVNRSIRVSDVVLRSSGDDPHLTLSINLIGNQDAQAKTQTVPITIEIEGARSTVEVAFDGSSAELKGHRIAVPREQGRGWGRVSIPADANGADNDFYFTFDVAPPRRSLIVTDDDQVGRVLKLAAEIPSDVDVQCVADVVSPDGLAAVDWQTIAMVLWHGDVSKSERATIERFVGRGGTVIFLPGPNGNGTNGNGTDGNAELPFGVKWGAWQAEKDPVSIASWRGDADLLSATLSGTSLPVGGIRIERFAAIDGEVTPLATLVGGKPLLGRVATPRGGVYLLATTPSADDSSLAADGVVLYVMIQRALESGARSLRNIGQQTSGESDADAAANFNPIASRDDRMSTERAFTAGVYVDDAKWLAINRGRAEDQSPVVDDTAVDQLFGDLVLDRIDQSAGNTNSIVEEVWRAFLVIMLIAMIGEACLCLPRHTVDSRSSLPKGVAA
ncbi:hypothetical protein Poly51_51060 [Rubripirellula tenax]|uniref:Aerotolerance regulator N-terminal domain-containing protein n=1 Tax=Rubripirellula tenax TaxID=2528015 RepID=A0A5C6EI39_9BACT|nr:BatA domain-containing protein [Rubripirellula tenax]TWU47306.1 hypothetical protein Poly51_51060 [Rubripirellula tenax]